MTPISASSSSISSSLARVSVSFSGCGFLAPFHLGSAASFRNRKVNIEHALGSSSGSLVAAAVILDVPQNFQRERFYRMVKLATSLPFGAFSPSFDFGEAFRTSFEESIPPDGHKIVSGRLTISMTDTNLTNRLVDHFESRADLIDCLVCSCFLPGFSGYKVPTYQGKVFLDGGLSNNQPVLDPRTICVNPLACGGHICPRDEVVALDKAAKRRFRKAGVDLDVSVENLRRLYRAAAPLSDMEYLYKEGWDRTETFIDREDFLPTFNRS